jgi:hypothetical protein
MLRRNDGNADPYLETKLPAPAKQPAGFAEKKML